MKKLPVCVNLVILSLIVFILSCNQKTIPGRPGNYTILISDTIQYHPVRINNYDGSILPWYSSEPGESYDTCLMLVWNFWNKMGSDSNGLKYYMNHQVWKPEHDMRGLGGDQINMALSSWALLYAYTGDTSIIDDMKYMANEYLKRSLSKPGDAWPYIPYPYNTVIHSGIYDGDMRNGKNITQPDKAGNFGYELVKLYKITGDSGYLEAAHRIAATLISKLIPGDDERSPLPFRVNAVTGQAGLLLSNTGSGKIERTALYTSNWTGTMMLFEELSKLYEDERKAYDKAFNTLLDWMKNYPLKTNKWGPFFEDIPGWSDTQTNAISFAMFILDHRELFPEWQSNVKGIFDWTYRELGNHEYEKYKVTVMNEQTVYRVPGNSHSSRQASAELMYASISGDTTYTRNAVRTLNWATYTVAGDGRNRYIRDDIWLTDGYGDYVRHYLRAMASLPELAPAGRNRLLSSTSVIRHIKYSVQSITYSTFDNISTEELRLTRKPAIISMNGNRMPENTSENSQGWRWRALDKGGILYIIKTGGTNVVITF